jgi:hypothetical protein
MCHKKIEAVHERIDHLELKLILNRILDKIEELEELLLVHIEESHYDEDDEDEYVICETDEDDEDDEEDEDEDECGCK